MEKIHESAIDLHRELRRRGLELKPLGRDAQLHNAIASRLRVPKKGFSRALGDFAISAEDYLRALMEVAQPFAQMFNQIWAYLSKHCAPKANESLFIRFGFGEKSDKI